MLRSTRSSCSVRPPLLLLLFSPIKAVVNSIKVCPRCWSKKMPADRSSLTWNAALIPSLTLYQTANEADNHHLGAFDDDIQSVGISQACELLWNAHARMCAGTWRFQNWCLSAADWLTDRLKVCFTNDVGNSVITHKHRTGCDWSVLRTFRSKYECARRYLELWWCTSAKTDDPSTWNLY